MLSAFSFKTVFLSKQYKALTRVKMKSLSLIVLFALALPAMGTDPLTLTLGSTAYTLTSAQVSIAAASVAALALTKELLILADLGAFRKGKRDVNAVSQAPLDFAAYFETIAKSDTKVATCDLEDKVV